MSERSYNTIDVPVTGGAVKVGIWDAAPDAPTVLLVHGVTSSHLAFPFVIDNLPGVRIVAPDLRGRGASNSVLGPAGMRAHAADLVAVLDRLGIDRTLVVGHSMGAFVAVVFAGLSPERVSRLVLIDGGLELDVPAALSADELVERVLGSTAKRLSMRFASREAYRDFWREHPAFVHDWSPELERYLDYDAVPDGQGAFRPATSYATTVDDMTDMYADTALADAWAQLRLPVRLITAPRGLRNEEPGLYSADYLGGLLPGYPDVEHERWDDFNHYTIVLSDAGGAAVAAVVHEELAKK